MTASNNPFSPDAFAKMFQTPDMTRMMEQFQIPGMDMGALMATQRKNMDALAAASQAATQGYQQIARRQMEIFQHSMQRAQAQMSAMGETDPARRADMMKAAMEEASANMTEIAEAARKAAEEAFEILSKRMQESMSELTAGAQ